MKRKSIIISILIVVIFNFISVNSFAALDQKEFESFTNGEAGVTDSTGNTQAFSFNTKNTKSTGATIVSALGKIFLIPAGATNFLLNIVVSGTTETTKINITEPFTIENLLFQKYDLFDINFFRYQQKTDTNNGQKYDIVTNVNGKIKTQVSKWYYIIRNLSLTLSVIILIYIGIRMAMSTVAGDEGKASKKADYKKMLTAWLTSIILIFILHYIFIFIFTLFDLLMGVAQEFYKSTGGSGIEGNIINGIRLNTTRSNGWGYVPNLILYYMVVYFQLKFFVIYANRMLEMSFLTIISPIVTITYSIDKVGDNRSQAFSALLKTIILKVFIQLIHVITYIIFIMSAGVIAQKAPLLAVLFFSALSRAEKIVRNVFNFKGKGLGDFKLRKMVGK